MELKIDSEEALVLTRVLRGLLPYLEQEAYASENIVPICDCLEDEAVVKSLVERLEAARSMTATG